MAQTMTRSKFQDIPKPDLEQTAAQPPDAMTQTSSRQQRGRQVRVPVLEPTTDELEGKVKESAKSKNRQPRNRCQTCLKHESGKRARKLHRGKPSDSEPGQQRRPHSAERWCTAREKRRRSEEASSSRKTENSTKEREDGIPQPAERLISKIQDRGNGQPRAMQERSVKNKTRSRI